MAPESIPEPLRVALEFAGLLERLGVRYVAAGAFASSVHGTPRSTDDIDIVAELLSRHIEPLRVALRGDYYVDDQALRDAVAGGATFNAIHLGSAVKVDVFVVGGDAFDAERVALGQRARVLDNPPREISVDLPEHTIVRKLEWFRRGGEASDRQWRDVLGVLRVQRGRLDRDRMRTWAARLGVGDLLERAEREAGE